MKMVWRRGGERGREAERGRGESKRGRRETSKARETSGEREKAMNSISAIIHFVKQTDRRTHSLARHSLTLARKPIKREGDRERPEAATHNRRRRKSIHRDTQRLSLDREIRGTRGSRKPAKQGGKAQKRLTHDRRRDEENREQESRLALVPRLTPPRDERERERDGE